MGSLQDQLLQSGLVDEKKLAERKQQGRKSKRRSRRARHNDGGEPSLAQAYQMRERNEQRQAEQSKRAKLAEEARRRKINESLKKLILPAVCNVEDAEETWDFMAHGRIRHLYVTPEQRVALAGGALGIVTLRGRYYLVPTPVARQAAEIKTDALVFVEDSPNS